MNWKNLKVEIMHLSVKGLSLERPIDEFHKWRISQKVTVGKMADFDTLTQVSPLTQTIRSEIGFITHTLLLWAWFHKKFA